MNLRSNRLVRWGAALLAPPALLFLYQLARELSGRLAPPVALVGENPVGLLALAGIAAGLPLAAAALGLLAAWDPAARLSGLKLTAAAVALVLANIAARAS
ncbi:MAG: hypothetical protein R3325_13030 [Thermoanaerobaculia bacterium]|nr:hypothetical protein [Thermoanaerobaculia bacterium]